MLFLTENNDLDYIIWISTYDLMLILSKIAYLILVDIG